MIIRYPCANRLRHAACPGRPLSAGHHRDRPVGRQTSQKHRRLCGGRSSPAAGDDHHHHLCHVVRFRNRARDSGAIRRRRPQFGCRRPVWCRVLPDFCRPFLCRQALPHDAAHHQRLLPRSLRARGRGGLLGDHHPQLSRLGVGAGHRAWPGLQCAVGRCDLGADGYGDRHGVDSGLHPVWRHVVGGGDRFHPDDHSGCGAADHCGSCERIGWRRRQGDRPGGKP